MGRLTRFGRQIRWYIGALMGDNHYQRYLAHRSRAHPGQAVLSESEYWRRRHRQAGADPGARCC